MCSSFFITATGTGVGKTLVTEALCREGRRRGRRVAAAKPVISGWDAANITATDTGRLLAAQGRAFSAEEMNAVSPWRLQAPLSPDMAAAREGRTIDREALVAWCRGMISESEKKGGISLIEGVGGAMVPLNNQDTVRDWIAALDIPAIVVAGSYLGTLSHTLSTLEALRVREISVALLVVSASEDSPVPLAETCATLARFVPETPIHPLPRIDTTRPMWETLPEITSLADTFLRAAGRMESSASCVAGAG